MKFTDKYTTADLIAKEAEAMLLDKELIPVEKDKIVLPTETYVIGEVIDEVIQSLINKIEHARTSLMK